jgi:hypothetical protein
MGDPISAVWPLATWYVPPLSLPLIHSPPRCPPPPRSTPPPALTVACLCAVAVAVAVALTFTSSLSLSFMPHRPHQPRQAAPAQTPASAPAPAPAPAPHALTHTLTLTPTHPTYPTHALFCPSCCPQILQPAAASRPCSLQRRGGVKRSAANLQPGQPPCPTPP